MKIIGSPDIAYTAIHHTAVSSVVQPTQLYAVNRYHKQKWNVLSSLGWYGGYNFFCDVDGKITQYRAVGEETVANKGHNCSSASDCDTISFCFAGNFNKELPNTKQVAAFKKWYAELDFTTKLVGHRDLQANRSCPGDMFDDTTMKKMLLQEPYIPDYKDKLKEQEIADLSRQLDRIRKMLMALLGRL